MSLSNFGLISLTTLSHQLPLFYQTGFGLSTFILRHLHSVFLEYVCFSLPDWDLLKALGHSKMKERIWVNIQKQQLPNSHWQSQPLLLLARMIHSPALQAPSMPSSWLLCSSWQEPASSPLSQTKSSAIQSVEKAGSTLECCSTKQSVPLQSCFPNRCLPSHLGAWECSFPGAEAGTQGSRDEPISLLWSLWVAAWPSQGTSHALLFHVLWTILDHFVILPL